MFTQDKINKDLAENSPEGSEFQRKLLSLVQSYMTLSANKMSEFHTQWDTNAYLYRGYRKVDKDDADAVKDGEPPKITIPIAYAQLQTALSFIVSTFSQRENLFEVRGFGPEDEMLSFGMNRDLSYQVKHQALMLKIYYWLLDAGKQGVGVVRSEWREEYQKMRVSRQEADFSGLNLFGQLKSMFGNTPGPMRTVESIDDVLMYQGNHLENISPYAFYPDPSVSVARFQEGRFVFTEVDTSMSALEELEGTVYFGTEKIPNTIKPELYKSRSRRVSGPFSADQNGQPVDVTGKANKSSQVLRTEGEFVMSEKELSRKLAVDLGSDTKPVKWLITWANDQKIIRFEKVGNLHGRFNYSLIEWSPDHDQFLNPGLSETTQELQNIMTFLLNSHVVNIRKLIANRFIVNPDMVHMEDIKSGSIYIRTKGVVSDVNRAIQQVAAVDATKGNLVDASGILTLIQTITGINDNAIGQYSSGRRSATEARNVNAGAAARLKMHATNAWLQGIEPLALQWLANTRQWRTAEVYAQIVGDKIQEAPFERVILADPTKIAGGYDFVPYDATLPTDRQFQAGVLQELFGLLVSNPNTIQLLQKDPMKLMNYIAELYNIQNLKDFDLAPLPTPQVQVVPNQVAAEMSSAGVPSTPTGPADLLNALRQ